MGFLDTLASEMTAARRAQSISNTLSPYLGGPATPAPTGGLLSRLLGIPDASAAPQPPAAASGVLGQALGDPAPSGRALPYAPTIGPAPAVEGNSVGTIARLDAAGATPSTAPPGAPGANRAFSPLPAGPLASFAAANGTNAQQALAFYQNKGLSPLASAALVGGFTQERGHGLNTAALNRGDGSDGSNSIGIAQWNGDRARAFHQFAASNGLNPADLDTQLQFSWAELNGPERATLAALQGAQNPGQATAAALGYERPAGWTAQNPYGAKTFGARLAATNGLSAGGGAVPALRGGGGSPFGGMAPASPADTSALPTMAASGMGLDLSRATRFAPPAGRGGMAYSAAGQPQQTDDQGNALDANGRPTAMGYSAGSGMVTAPGQRAIAAAAPLDGDAPLPRTAQSYVRGPGTSPGTAAAAANIPPSQAGASPSALNGSRLDDDMIRTLIQNPDTQPFGLELWKSKLTQTPANLEHVEGKDGSIYLLNPRTGAMVKVAEGGTAPMVVGKALVDPRTGRALYDGNNPDTRTLSPTDYARYGVPDGTPGPVQVDGEGKLLFPMKAGTSVNVSTDNRAEGAEAKGRGEGLAKRFNEIAEAGGKADEDAAMYDRFGDLLNSVPTGARTAVLEKVRGLTGLALDPNTDNVQALNAAIQYLAPRLRVPGSGAQSDRELGNFLSSIPSLMGTAGGNQQILDTLRGVTEYKRSRAGIANSWQLGDISAKDAQQQLGALPSPFARRSQAAQSGTPGAPAASTSAPVSVTSPQDAMRLPSGTAIRLPDGRIGKVP